MLARTCRAAHTGRMRVLVALLSLMTPTLALEGGTPVPADHPLSRATVAVQAVSPQPDGTARLAECSGVLIAQDLVLTAGHCVDEAASPQHAAVFFFRGSQVVPQVAAVAAIVRHPRHVRGWARTPGVIEERQGEIAADIAILRLKVLAPASQAPIAFGPVKHPDVLTLASAGKAGPDGKSGTLKSSVLASIYHTRTGPALAFATPGSGQVCTGDSGGPVVTAAGTIWGVAGAIVRSSKGCSKRFVVVPIYPLDPDIAEMIRVARDG